VSADSYEALLRLSLRIAHRYAAAKDMLYFEDELADVAASALARAINGHDPAKGPLKPYAVAWIVDEVKGAVRDEQERARHEVPLEETGAPRSRHPVVRCEEVAGDLVDVLLSVYVGEELSSNGEAELLTRQAFAALHQEMGRLATEDQQLLALRYWEEKTWAGVAEVLGVSENAARKRDGILRARLHDGLIAWDRVRPIAKRAR
jgi:RNA polymerase sigma factor (sigma-70 family)